MSDLESLLQASTQLPAVPDVVQSLILSFEDPDADIDRLAEKISHDPALAAKVLRLANTPAYGGSRKVASIADAVMMLGFNTLRTLVLACGLAGQFRQLPGIDMKMFWRRSFRVASTAAWLAKLCRRSPDLAFTVGLLHNVGQLLLAVADAPAAQAVARLIDEGEDRFVAEMNVLGFTSVAAAAELAGRWRFPRDIVEGIAGQQLPLQQDPLSEQALLVHLALIMVRGTDAGGLSEQPGDWAAPGIFTALALDPALLRQRYGELVGLGDELALLVA